VVIFDPTKLWIELVDEGYAPLSSARLHVTEMRTDHASRTTYMIDNEKLIQCNLAPRDCATDGYVALVMGNVVVWTSAIPFPVKTETVVHMPRTIEMEVT
jgi:hypothetical protein